MIRSHQRACSAYNTQQAEMYSTARVRVVLSLLLLLFLGCSTNPTGRPCPTLPWPGPSCACDLPSGVGRIDLSPLSSNSGSPKFTDIGPDPNGYVYDYNPCSTFNSVNGGCADAFICQTSNSDPSRSYQLADAGREQIWIDTDGTPYIYYTAYNENSGSTKESYVHLVCDHSLEDGKEQITTDGDTDVILNYVFYLSSCHVCPGGCPATTTNPGASGPKKGDMSISIVIGTVFIIGIITSGLVTCFIVGAVVYVKVKFHSSIRQGYTQAPQDIPN